MDPSYVLMMLASRWTRSLAGAALASTIIWTLFPLVPALRPVAPRLIAIAGVFAVCLVINAALSWRRRRREKLLAAGIAGESGRDAKEGVADAAAEVGALRERMRHALARLRKHGRVRLYDQPWFVLIGPPGSGKTTALRNAGLHFPLARDDDERSVSGVGGTRLCDWWFAEEAVLIDTAGRYTTQDSDAAIDRAGWQGFLDLLRRTRPRQPLNGVIVVLSLTGIANADEAERRAHARAVRRRIDEITERLRVRLPVYVVFSKADQLNGFDAYFDDLDTAGRAQVWGATFQLQQGVEAFAAEFRLLLARLEERSVERLQAERSAERRALIGGFPLQVASLEQPLCAFMADTFAGSRLDPAPLLRGVYITSATQEGTPIDRLTGLLARSFGIDQARLPSLRPVQGKSYFVTRLIREVILGEAMLVSSPPKRRRRRLALRIAGFASVAVVSAAVGAMIWRADARGHALIQHDDEALAAFRARLAAASLDPVRSADMPAIVSLLDEAGTLRSQPATGGILGLSQSDKLAQAGRLAYARALQRILLPRLVWRLEQQMRAHLGDPDVLYAATRIYLMLGDAGPLEPALVRAWWEADWQATYPGTLNTDLRMRLLDHLDALLAAPLPAISLDGGLVGTARATFSRVSAASRIYGRIRESAAGSVPSWTPLSILAPEEASYFTTISGRSLGVGIPGLFTAAGLRDVLLRNLPGTAHAVASESWVLGRQAEIPTEGATVAALEEAVIGLWAADARQAWDSLLGDLALTAFGGRDQAVQRLYVLGSPQSPLRDMLRGIGQALDLEAAEPRKDGQVALIASAEAAPTGSPAIMGLERHFASVLALSHPQSGSQFDAILRLINLLEQELSGGRAGDASLAASLPATLQASGDPAQLLLAEASRQPPPVSRWLRQVAAAGTQTLGAEAHSALTASYSADGGPASLCPSVVDGRFPFDPESSQDAPIGDFIRLFAPGGVLDSYFQSAIKPYADMRGPVWRVQALGGVKAPVDRTALAAFQRAAAIRDAFFPAGAQPLVTFTIESPPVAAADSGAVAAKPGDAKPGDAKPGGAKPGDVKPGDVKPGDAKPGDVKPGDVKTGSVGSHEPILTLGAASVQAHSGIPVSLSWPGSDGMVNASVRGAAATPLVQAHGPWALFRLLAQARVLPETMSESYALSFPKSGRAVFLLSAGSAHNPFGGDLLAGFHCPVVR